MIVYVYMIMYVSIYDHICMHARESAKCVTCFEESSMFQLRRAQVGDMLMDMVADMLI